ncbi:titin-like isoform X4 [Gambusia affinis]|uniref:titin-like isoform X4 n=1 Tax=Gambusia affinis TaxID=33528 RepID=UPI001CDC5514|nr:titin-like isoform X4 [Gambusia affinis]
MSLQVCHCCGWTKVTTHHGLRVHQGRMGCTPKGTRVAEPQQQYAWNHGGQTNINFSYKLDIQNTVKIESSNYYSDMSLQTCHCGWKKITNYHGLRTHQGMMGCTAKGLRIPKEEQSAWRDHWKPQLDNKTLPVAKKVNTKEENSPEIPRMSDFSNPTSAGKVKKENKSASSQKATRSKSRHQLEERFTPLKSTEEYWSAGSSNNHATAASRIKAEPVSPLEVCIPRYPEGRSTTSAERNQSSLHLKMNHWPGEIPAVEPEDMYRFFSELPSAPTEVLHGKKDSLLPTSGQETPRSQLLKEIHNCLEKYEKRRDEKTMNSAHETVDESPRISTNSVIKAESLEKNQSCVATQQHPVKKPTETKTAAAEQRNESVSKCSANKPPVPAKRKSLVLLTGTPEKAEGSSASANGEMKNDNKKEEPVQNVRQTTKLSSSLEEKNSPPPSSLRNLTDTKVTSPEQVSRAAPPVVPPKRKLRSFQVRQLSGRDFTNDLERANREMKVKELVRMFSVSAAQENAVGTEEKLGSEQPRVVKLLAQRHSAMPAQESRIQPEVEEKQEKRATDIKPEITPTAAEVPQKEAPSSLCEAANPDVPTNMTVKELAQMFSTQETAAGPKEKRGPGHRSSQVKLMAQRFLQPTSTDAAGQLKKKDHDSVPRPQQKLPDATCNSSKMKTAAQKPTMHQEHKPSDEATQVAGLSSRSKVKDLARMFSTRTM